MMFASFCVLFFTAPDKILQTMINASGQTLSLCVNLCGVYIVWLGILELVDKSGLGDKIASLLRPLLKKLFKTTDPQTQKLIALNMSSNMLGLGNASTPLGIEAIKRLDDGSGKATRDVIMLIVLNATSIQLLPTTIMGLRTSAGSLNSSDIILPTLIATIFTFILGICLTKLLEKIFWKNKKENNNTN